MKQVYVNLINFEKEIVTRNCKRRERHFKLGDTETTHVWDQGSSVMANEIPVAVSLW